MKSKNLLHEKEYLLQAGIMPLMVVIMLLFGTDKTYCPKYGVPGNKFKRSRVSEIALNCIKHAHNRGMLPMRQNILLARGVTYITHCLLYKQCHNIN